jgi:hypothetical protein
MYKSCQANTGQTTWGISTKHLQEFTTIPTCAYHDMFRFAAQNGRQY